MTPAEKAFADHLKRVLPLYEIRSGGRKEPLTDETILQTWWEAHEDWQAACYWAWQHPEEGIGVLPPNLKQGKIKTGQRRCKPGQRVMGTTWEGILPEEEMGDEWQEQG